MIKFIPMVVSGVEFRGLEFFYLNIGKPWHRGGYLVHSASVMLEHILYISNFYTLYLYNLCAACYSQVSAKCWPYCVFGSLENSSNVDMAFLFW